MDSSVQPRSRLSDVFEASNDRSTSASKNLTSFISNCKCKTVQTDYNTQSGRTTSSTSSPVASKKAKLSDPNSQSYKVTSSTFFVQIAHESSPSSHCKHEPHRLHNIEPSPLRSAAHSTSSSSEYPTPSTKPNCVRISVNHRASSAQNSPQLKSSRAPNNCHIGNMPDLHELMDTNTSPCIGLETDMSLFQEIGPVFHDMDTSQGNVRVRADLPANNLLNPFIKTEILPDSTSSSRIKIKNTRQICPAYSDPRFNNTNKSSISQMITTTQMDGNNNFPFTHDNHSMLPPFSYLLPPLSLNVSDQMCGDVMIKSEVGESWDMNRHDSQSSGFSDDDELSLTPLMNLQFDKDIDTLHQLEDYVNFGLGDPSLINEFDRDDPLTELLVESEGYDSSQESGSFFYEPNVAYNFEYPPQQVYPRETGPAPNQYQNQGQPSSPASDEGFVEEQHIQENLPNFEKIQNHPAEQEKNEPEANMTSSPKSKERKRHRETPDLSDKDRRKPGRKPGQVSNVLHLWEFMRDLLLSPEHSSIIEWISKQDGVFRVTNSSEVARLWGEKKNNKKKMTYEKLSRSLRYSRLEGYFSKLPKDKNYPKKLCFKFGPKSHDWDKCFL